jgi:hypothetical protein
MNGNGAGRKGKKDAISPPDLDDVAAGNVDAWLLDADDPLAGDTETGPAGAAGIVEERIGNLREAIQEIDDALARRKVLNFRFLEQIDRERDAAMHQLEALQPPWRTGFYPQIEFLRLSLHKSVTSRSTDHRREQLKYWEDAVNLAKERRRFLDEYKALATWS